jgi:uncharacterized membrane protein YadS
MANEQGGWSDLLRKEDWWAVWLGLGTILLCLAFYAADLTGVLKFFAVKPPTWSAASTVTAHLASAWPGYLTLFAGFLVVFTISTSVMGFPARQYLPGFVIVFVASLIILVLSSSRIAKDYNLEAPLLALIVGLIVGNVRRTPAWFDAALRTEYYIKTGIVLLGATLPLTLIVSAGPIAFLQATIVSLTTWLTIYFVSTRIFRHDPRFAAVLGAAGAVCGVSASIAVGASVKAKKEHIAIGIAVVSVWAIVMIFFIPIAGRALGLEAPVVGAWIGTSEFADAAGYAAAAAVGHESAIQAFTLMKVIGRDIWIGIWCFVLSIVAVTVWEKRQGNGGGQRVGAGVVWERFPKFVLGFVAASILMTFIVESHGGSSGPAFDALKADLITPIKTLRTWTFVFTFLCIGLTTRFRELLVFGWRPFWAFTAGVFINVPLGYFLSAHLFREFWLRLQ